MDCETLYFHRFRVSPIGDELDDFRLFDFLLDNDVKIGGVSIYNVCLGREDRPTA